MVPIITSQQSIIYVEAVLVLPFLVLGVSHIVQRQMWTDFFIRLAGLGHTGVVVRSFMFELWPAVIIVVFHQDWSFPGKLITIYGYLLMIKVALSLIVPNLGLKSLQQAKHIGNRAFLPAGIALLGLGVLCGVRVMHNIGIPAEL